jgi:hypothetical protein
MAGDIASFRFMNSKRSFPLHCLAFVLGMLAFLTPASRVQAESEGPTDITTLHSNMFFRVSVAVQPRYGGAQACSECHRSIHSSEMNTRHAKAFQTLKQIHQDQNPSCLPCHTVGYGLPSGFKNEATTPKLAGVQCESCHGPSARHMASEFNPKAKPLVEAAGTMCGGCHTGSHHPTYDEWSASEHAEVVEDMNPASRINACGRCHSGSVRVSLINKRALPVRKANVPLGCVACHDPHARHTWKNPVTGLQYTNQLRSPLFSTNSYSLATTDVFKKKYNPNVNVCGQCHNQRGASWQSTSRPPHPSPQYNILLGNLNDTDTRQPHYQPSSHALLIPNQCAGCHMQTAPASGETAALTGHAFTVNSLDACKECHPFPELLTQVVQDAFSAEIQDLKQSLDLWATTRAPAALRAKYGTLAWEYTNPGQLSSGGAGPDSNEQKQIPVRIQKARFNLYLVVHDGSLGIHNPDYTGSLLQAASQWIEDEMKLAPAGIQ